MIREAIVIGGGPAGSVAAILLARGGCGVTLIEQHRFPRDKVCGECVSALGADVLRRLGIFPSLASAGAVRLDRALLHSPSGVSVDVALSKPMWGVSRTALDGLLLDAAARAGARVRQPARCEALEPGERPAVRVRDLVHNTVERFDAEVVIVADGKAALFDDGPPPPGGDLGIKTHFENVDGPRDAVELFSLHGCYGGLAPIEGYRWNAALSVPASRVRACAGNLTALFERLVEENVVLGKRIAGARQVGGWLASAVPRFAVRGDWPRGVVPVGNAAAAIEPIGGEGMGMAMWSAEMAAARLLERPARGGPKLIHADYRKAWRSRRVACRAAALFTSSRRCVELLAPLLRAAPAALRPAMTLLGK